MYLKNFDPNITTKYYYPCGLPFISERLKASGCFCPISLLFCVNLFSIPIYMINQDNSPLDTDMWETRQLNYKSPGEILKYHSKQDAYPDSETGIAGLTAQISRNEMPIVCGSTYFLPHSGNYKNQKYIMDFLNSPNLPISGHWIGVIGIENDGVTVLDTTPDLLVKKISKTDFINFWAGDKIIPELAEKTQHFHNFGFRKINIDEAFDKSETINFMKRSLKTIAYEHFEGKTLKKDGITYFFGNNVLLNFLKNLTENSNLLNMQKYINCFFFFFFSRYFLKEILTDLVSFYNEADIIRYERLLDSITKIVEAWDIITSSFSVKLIRKNYKDILPLFEKEVIKLNDMEKDLHSEILKMHNQCDMLPKK